jgi:hypothetical protein
MAQKMPSLGLANRTLLRAKSCNEARQSASRDRDLSRSRRSQTANARSAESRGQAADDFARLIRPLLDGELADLSANAAAAELNRRGVQTARADGKWTARGVLNLKARKISETVS